MRQSDTVFSNFLPIVAILAATMIIVMIGLMSGANAKKMRSGSAGLTAAMGDCLAASDSTMASSPTKTACCSKEVGICVVCPRPESPGMMCDVVNYGRYQVPDNNAPRADPSIENKKE